MFLLFVAINHERFITEPLDQIEARVASKQRIIFEGSLLTKIVGASKEFVTCEMRSLRSCRLSVVCFCHFCDQGW